METRKMEFTDVLIGDEDGSFHPLTISSLEELDFWSDYLVNVFPALKDGDFLSRRATFRPSKQQVPSRVDIPIVRGPAVRAMPMPHSKTCDTFRAADASAIGTGPGRKSFVDDFEINAVP